jgi:glutamate 5-kinase
VSVAQAKRVVVKVGTSTLTYPTGRLHFKRIEQLVRVLADLKNAGKEIILVTSGAIGVGVAKLKLGDRPKETRMKQAAASVGQSELMALYDRLFLEYGHTVGQILMTRLLTDRDNTKSNLVNTFETLLSLGVIPIVNENDSVAVEEIDCEDLAFGGNDQLSAIVATLVHADLLVLLSDIEGLYDKDPHKNPDARLIPYVERIDGELARCAGGPGSSLGTGGMRTKLEAAALATAEGVDMVIMDGSDPSRLYELFEGRQAGTFFPAQKEARK